MDPTRSRASASPKPRDPTPGMAVRGEGDIPTLSNTNQNIINLSKTRNKSAKFKDAVFTKFKKFH